MEDSLVHRDQFWANDSGWRTPPEKFPRRITHACAAVVCPFGEDFSSMAGLFCSIFLVLRTGTWPVSNIACSYCP